MVLACISLTVTDVEHLSKFLFAILMYLWKSVLKKKYLSGICRIFFLTVAVLSLIPLTVYFKEQKFILIELNSSTLPKAK